MFRLFATRATFASSSPMTLWLLAVTPMRLPSDHEVGDHLRSHRALPRPGRPLDGQVALVHRLHEATGYVLSVLAVTEKGMTFALTQPGWTTSEQVAWRAVWTRSVKTVLQHEVGEALQALWLWPRSHKIVRDQRGRSWRGPSFASLEVDHSFLVVDVDNLPCSAPGLGIMRRVVDSDGMVLGWEAEPIDGGARSEVWGQATSPRRSVLTRAHRTPHDAPHRSVRPTR